MLPSVVKNKIEQIWLDVIAGGVSQPTEVIEQLTYLMFAKQIDEREADIEMAELLSGEKQSHIFGESREEQALRWRNFKGMEARALHKHFVDRVFIFLINLNSNENSAFSRYLKHATFKINEPLALQKVVAGLEDLFENDIKDLDMQGDLYEYMLGKLNSAGRLGAFRTPKHIRDMMVKLMMPTINKENINESLLAITNTTKTELLFVALFIRLLRVGGRCACIVPDGVLFGSSKAHKNLRKELIENQYLEAVISMPSGVFKPYAGVSTAILIFTKTNGTGTDKVWFYDMKADGYSLDDKRQPVQENDIPDIIERFHKKENEEDRERTEQSFMVDKQEIIDNGYDLSINKYKKIEYVPVEYPPTEEILAEIEELNEEITKETAELRALLRK